MYVLVTLTILYVAQAAGAASSETAEIATGPDPAQLWNGESGAAQEKLDASSSRCMGASSSDGSGSLAQCTGYYYYEGRCTSNSCCQGGREIGYGEHGWCGIGTAESPGGWAYCTANCNNVPGFDEEDYANLEERVYNIDHRTISADFKITRGRERCKIDAQGCATNGDEPVMSGSDYRCEFEIRKEGYLFLTEWNIPNDQSIRIAGNSYTGDEYFHNLGVKATDKIEFRKSSTSTGSGTGFAICLSNSRQGENDIVPPPTLAPANFYIDRSIPYGACEIDENGCVHDGAGNYGDSEYCRIRVGEMGWITFETFDVEYHYSCKYDYLLMPDGRKYCGSRSDVPDGFRVQVNDVIIWTSDSSVNKEGWKLCLNTNPDEWPTTTYEAVPCNPLIHQCACEPCPPNWVP